MKLKTDEEILALCYANPRMLTTTEKEDTIRGFRKAEEIAREYAEELQLKIGAYEHALMALVNDGDRHLRLVEVYKDNPESVELHKRKAKERQEAVCIITLNRDLYIKFPQIRNASLATEAKQ